MEYGKLIFLKSAKISLKTKNSTISHKIYFSTQGAERNCKEESWISPIKVQQQIFARTMKNIQVKIWKSTFWKKCVTYAKCLGLAALWLYVLQGQALRWREQMIDL